MSLIHKIKYALKNRAKIWEGIRNTYFTRSKTTEQIAAERIKICRSNKCGLYDKDGSSENAYVKGEEACGGCGCNLDYKTHCLSCACFLKDLGQTPLWDEVKE